VPIRHRLAAASALVVLLVAISGCVPSTTLPSTCSEAAVTISATLSDNGMQPSQFDVCRDQEVTITVASQVAGELHFHGYDTDIPEQELEVGHSVTVKFTASHVGQFSVELHPADGSDEREVAKLVVQEP
jgi:CheY-specific phosphatase CheX